MACKNKSNCRKRRVLECLNNIDDKDSRKTLTEDILWISNDGDKELAGIISSIYRKLDKQLN